MSKGDNSPGMSKFAGVLADMVKNGSKGSLILDFGEIQKDKSLLTNTYPIPIPRSEYLVCRHLKGRSATTSSRTVGDHGSHSHTVETQRTLAVGDHVLVAWVQNDAVVVDVLEKASDAF